MSKNNVNKTTTSINVDELKSFLNHIIDNNKFLQATNKFPIAVEVVGESGIGKTSAIAQLANEKNLHFVKINLAQVEEIGDLVGFPIKQFEVELNGNPIWVDDALLETQLRNGAIPTGKNRMSYCPPEWISGKEEGGILLLDDWNRADVRFIQAVMELIDRQQYISWILPKNWHIILTANPDNGDYLVNSIDNAQKTRFVSTTLKFDIDCWGKWAESVSLDGRCINFLLLNPDLITTKTNSRSVSMFFNAISSIPDFEQNLPLIQMIGEGCVGAEFSSMFTTFINNKLDKMLSPKDLMELEESYVIRTLKSLVNNDGNYRADIASTISTRLVNYLEVYASEKEIKSSHIERICTLVKSEAFTTDICYNMVKCIYNSNKEKFKGMVSDKGLVKFILA